MVNSVREFMDKYGMRMARDELKRRPSGDPLMLLMMARATTQRANRELERRVDDLRVMRAHLIVEEVGELITAMIAGDEAGVLDAVCDLTYVAIGAGLAFELPVEAGFAEVHRSNMTKTRSDDRIRDKGPDYEPPNLERILRCTR